MVENGFLVPACGKMVAYHLFVGLDVRSTPFRSETEHLHLDVGDHLHTPFTGPLVRK